jgi:glycosyltransferase involved in cell wall biosynthesis
MSNIEIVTPAPAGSLHGNRITALRWQSFLKKLGHQVRVSNHWTGKDTDLLIALHAYRSHASIVQFRKKYTNHPIILILTGTDLHRDMAALALIPKLLHTKTHVIYQSCKSVKRKAVLKTRFLVSVIGHLRPEKDPFCTAKSLKYLGPENKIKVIHMGKAMSPEMSQLANQYSQDLENYQWQGELSHSDTLAQLSRSHLMVISSLMEGGAHVVTEAIAIGVPIIASDIPGNRGLLGDDYPGYYQVGNEKALAKILQKTESDAAFYQSLEKHIHKRRQYVQPEFELKSIKAVLDRLKIT